MLLDGFPSPIWGSGSHFLSSEKFGQVSPEIRSSLPGGELSVAQEGKDRQKSEAEEKFMGGSRKSPFLLLQHFLGSSS